LKTMQRLPMRALTMPPSGPWFAASPLSAV